MPDDLERTYRELAETLLSRDGACALILGPELAVDEQNIGYRSYFRAMKENTANGIANYFEKDNLFSFKDEDAFKRCRGLVKDFYRRSGDPVLLELISRIRFPLVINLCPDTALNDIYRRNGYDLKEGYFLKAKDTRFANLPYPTKDTPLLYNIFGIAGVDNTLILNHSKLYEVIQNLLEPASLPLELESFLEHASAFLLLGVRFDTWYYQLICHKLKLNSIKTNLSATGLNGSHGRDDMGSVSVVVRKHFGIDFAPENPLQAMERLISACNGSKEALRAPKEPSAYGLFVSYAWKDKEDKADVTRETPVDWAQRHSQLSKETSLKMHRDHDELSFGDSIDSFMTRIGKGKTVIRVISNEYLRSEYCMLESIRISQYNDDEKRVFNILWHDVDLNKEDTYRDFWRDKCKEMLEDIDKKLDNAKYDAAVMIFRFIIGFFARLRDRIGLQSAPGDFVVDAKKGIEVVDGQRAYYDKFIEDVIKKTHL